MDKIQIKCGAFRLTDRTNPSYGQFCGIVTLIKNDRILLAARNSIAPKKGKAVDEAVDCAQEMIMKGIIRPSNNCEINIIRT